MKTHYLIAAALIMAAACNRIQTSEEEHAMANGTVEVTFTVNGGMETRAGVASTSDEAKVSDIQIFVFDKSGKIESYAKADAATLTLNVSLGEKDFVALANCPDDFARNVATKTDLLTQTSYLKDNGSAKFEMTGSASGNITAAQSVNIEVRRIVSKVVLEKVSTNFTSPYYASKTFKITGIYLINTVATNNFGLTATTFEWMNQLKLDASNSAASLIQKTGMDQTVTSSVPYTTANSFYCYPNPTTSDSTDGSSWSVRKTRLVVEASLDGSTCYYSIALPVLERNKIYKITELNITKRGSANPWEEIKTADASFSITVADWDEESSGSVTI